MKKWEIIENIEIEKNIDLEDIKIKLTLKKI